MEDAKLFQNDDSHEVKMPNEDKWAELLMSLEMFTYDFLSEQIEQLPLNSDEGDSETAICLI